MSPNTASKFLSGQSQGSEEFDNFSSIKNEFASKQQIFGIPVILSSSVTTLDTALVVPFGEYLFVQSGQFEIDWIKNLGDLTNYAQSYVFVGGKIANPNNIFSIGVT